MVPIARFQPGALEELCRELADTMTGTQLTRLLQQAGLAERSTESTKWKRLYQTLVASQTRLKDGRPVVALLHAAMAPARFGSDEKRFEAHREALNVTLAFSGLRVRDDGRVVTAQIAPTISEARARANALQAHLGRRDVHPAVLAFCEPELLEGNYFHAVLEACKSVAEKIRTRSGLTGDTVKLVDEAFSLSSGQPPLAFNLLSEAWERDEHQGLAMFARGMVMTYRHPTAHAPKVRWAVEQEVALEVLGIASMLHRRLDESHVTPSAPAYRALGSTASV